MPSRPTAIVVPLRTGHAFDWPALRDYLANRTIPGLEHVDDSRYRRSVTVLDRVIVIEVQPTADDGLELVLPASHGDAVDAVSALARRALSLEPHAGEPDDTAEARRVLGADHDLAPLLAARPDLRVPGTWDGFETGVRAIVGQQVSVAGATTITARIVHRHGAGIVAPVHQDLPEHLITRAFPRPASLAHGDLTGLGLTNARMATIQGFAAAVAEGAIRLDHEGTLEELVASIIGHPGLGPWTAHYVALRLGHRDAFPRGDLALRRALDPSNPPSGRQLEQRAERWRPWRALAATHLWAADAARRPSVRPRGHEPTGPRGRRPV